MIFHIDRTIVSLSTFKALRQAVGWSCAPDEALLTSLQNTEFCVRVRHQDQTVGMGRIVGDRGFIYFVADVIVHPDYQGQGIGGKIMSEVMDYLRKNAPPHAYITLMAAQGKEAFYEKFGFFSRPTEKYGPGMMVELVRQKHSEL
jgi:GNAT superfamily N-acetyltransferase